MKYVAADGTEFSTEWRCKQYEKEHAVPEVDVFLRMRISDLKEMIWRHKSKYCFNQDKEMPDCRTTYVSGNNHRRALAKYKEMLAKGQLKYESRLEWLARIGVLAAEVLRWKEEEKKSIKHLRECRAALKTYKRWLAEYLRGEMKCEPVALFAERSGFSRVR